MATYLARPCPRCHGYLGIVLSEPGRNTPLRAIDGQCLDAAMASHGYWSEGSGAAAIVLVERAMLSRQKTLDVRQLGYVEGQNIAIERLYANGRMNRLPELAADLARLSVDVILAGSFPAALAAKEATTTIPIVVFGAGDPVATGLVASFARPGGNIRA